MHVHLKDVDAAMARRVRDGETSFGQAVRDRMFRPLGDGDIDIAAMVDTLEAAGYRGWYVLEQDVVLDGEPRRRRPRGRRATQPRLPRPDRWMMPGRPRVGPDDHESRSHAPLSHPAREVTTEGRQAVEQGGTP